MQSRNERKQSAPHALPPSEKKGHTYCGWTPARLSTLSTVRADMTPRGERA
jgi:hypothetical protein